MNIPGVNLYNLATQLIGKQLYDFYEFDGNTLDARGIDVPTYKDPVTLYDSIQAVPRDLYQSMGLEFQKYYVMIYTNNPLMVVERDRTGDEIEYQGRRYQILSNNDWQPQDGWQGVLASRQVNEVSP